MSKISVTTIAGLTSGGDANTVKIESGDTLAVQSNATVGGTLGVTGASTLTGATTATGGVTIPASTTVGINFGSGTDLAQLAMQSGVSDRIALRTTHTSSYDNNPFIIYQPSGAAAQNDALVVNTGGQITKSKNPAFTVRSTGGNNGNTWEQGQDIKFQVVDTDIGSNYSTSTGRFTAPVAGFYTFSYIGFGYSAGRVPAASTCSVQLRKNGSVVVTLAYNEVNTSTGYPSIGGTYSLALSANDYITIRAQSNGQYADSSGLYTALSGYLVG